MKLTQSSLQIHLSLTPGLRLRWHKPHATAMNQMELIRICNDEAENTIWALWHKTVKKYFFPPPL